VEEFWRGVTNFGDSVFVLPMAMGAMAYLGCRGHRSLAVALAVAIAGCGLAMVALKLLFGSCVIRFGATGIVSPSGHVAMSTVVYGCFAVLLARRGGPGWRSVAPMTGAVALIGAILVSRVVLLAHSVPETEVGLAVGALFVLGFWRAIRARAVPDLRLGAVLVLVGGLALTTYGVHLPIERTLRAIALIIGQHLPGCA
jgi:membrane-associated phospholipid phosphatase